MQNGRKEEREGQGGETGGVSGLAAHYRLPLLTTGKLAGLARIPETGPDDSPSHALAEGQEGLAVALAHGYARTTGRPIAVAAPGGAGLYAADEALYRAAADRCPVLLIGLPETGGRASLPPSGSSGSGPGPVVKWRGLAAAGEDVSSRFAQAYSIMMTEPQGPVCLDLDQIDPCTLETATPPPAGAVRMPPRIAADREMIADAAHALVSAEAPALLVGHAARAPIGYLPIVELAEILGAAVFDQQLRLGFPNRHPLNLTGDRQGFADSDLVLALDVWDWTQGPLAGNPARSRPETGTGARWIDLGFTDLGSGEGPAPARPYRDWDLRLLADPAHAIPDLTIACKSRVFFDPRLKARIQDRKQALARRHEAQWTAWQREAEARRDERPMHRSRLANALCGELREMDWVLGPHSLDGWAFRLWNFDRPYRHAGCPSHGQGFGLSLGIALAHRSTGKQVIDFRSSPELVSSLGAFPLAARWRLPILVIALREDGEGDVSGNGGPDMAALARNLGWHGEGVIQDPKDLGPALSRARHALAQGKPALIEVLVGPGGERGSEHGSGAGDTDF